jgi:hypothetical protein
MVYIVSEFWRFQSMIDWLIVFRLVVRQNIMVGEGLTTHLIARKL